MPGFAVDSDGTLHTSLMRSCTGWPSGTWIDPPRRTAPDGSNFQLQHWTHTFDYALVSGDGDWRHGGHPGAQRGVLAAAARRHRKHERRRRIAGVGVAAGDRARGTVPLGALKAAGNPLAGGSGQPVDPADGVAMRLVETCGATADVVVRSGLRRVSAPPASTCSNSPGCKTSRQTGWRCTGTRSPRC